MGQCHYYRNTPSASAELEMDAEWRAKLPVEQEAVASGGAGAPRDDEQDD